MGTLDCEGVLFRLAEPERDAPGVVAIYAPIVAQTPISFETAAVTVDSMARQMAETLPLWPWIVCTDASGLLGYAYASRHRVRAAYAWAVDVSVYLAPAARGRGLGRALYQRLLPLLRLLGYHNAFAGIALPNPASVGLHEAMGFKPVGIYRNVGFKLGAWHDVGWWQLELLPCHAEPAPPRTAAALAGTREWQAVIAGPPRPRP
jgi:L-amino acid N-acyltransferase YncA